MTQSSNSFLLPPRKKPAFGQTGFEQKAFKQWVDDLPKGNVGQTARALYEKLHAMNRLEIQPVERFRALEMMLGPLQFVFDGLSKDLIGAPLPLSKRNILIAELLTKLHTMVIQGYKVVLDQFHHDSIAGRVLHKGSRAEALHRVLFFMGKALLNAYQLYQVPPKHIWQEIHGLYHYAVESKLHDKLLDNEERQDIRKSTATDLYKRILLLSRAGPYRLQSGDIGKVYHALLGWVSKVRLINLAHAGPDDGHFLVDIAADNAPKYREILGDEIIKIGWALDTSGLAAELGRMHEQLTKLNGETPSALSHPQQMSLELLEKMMLCWGVGPQRSDDRVPEGGQITVACGIEVLYNLLGGEELSELSQSSYRVGILSDEEERSVTHEPISRSRIASDEYLVDGGPELKDFFNPREKLAEVDEAEGLGQLIIDSSDDLEGGCIKRCTICDRSVNGFHLLLTSGSDSRVRVGELVGVKRDQSPGFFTVGVIRWIKAGEKKGGMEFGVELFQGEMTPVVIRRKKMLENTVDSWRGFRHRTPQKAETLFASLFYAGNDDQFFLRMDSGEVPIVLGRALESSASFVQFQFRSEGLSGGSGHSEQERGETGQMEDDLEFDSIWNEIK